MKLTRISTLVLLSSVAVCVPAAAAQTEDSIRVSIGAYQKYSSKEMLVHRFLWNKWHRRQRATATVTFFGFDWGVTYTIEIKPDSNGRWLVRESVQRYHVPSVGSKSTTLVAEGVSLHRLSLRGVGHIVELISADGKAIPLFENRG